MNNRYQTGSLSAEQLACLRYLSQHPDTTANPFGTQLLDGLVARGLVKKVRMLALPVMPQQYRYRLTPKGRKVLEAQSTR